jgi:hypothetical protein
VINQSLNNTLLPAAERQAEQVLSQYDQARTYLAKILEKEAEDNIRRNLQQLAEVEQRIAVFGTAVAEINTHLEAMQLDRHRLPGLSQAELRVINAPQEEPTVYQGTFVGVGDRN